MNDQIPDPKTMTLGSNAWVEAVYQSGPARETEGRSRPTHRYFGAADTDIDDVVMEGRNEYIAYLLLCVLRNSGIVSRFKGQPFRLDEECHGVYAYPDFMFDLVDGRRFVLEVKSNRFIDEKEKVQLEAVNAAFTDTSINYLLWTDKWPLHRPVIHAMNHLRRAHRQSYPDDHLQSIRQAVQRGPRTMRELRTETPKFHFDEVLAAAYRGRVFLNIFQKIDDYTKVTYAPDLKMIELLFQTRVQGAKGWDAGTKV